MFKIRLLRLTQIDGKTRLAGAVAQLPAEAARSLIVAGRARLDAPADLKQLLALFEAEAIRRRLMTR